MKIIKTQISILFLLFYSICFGQQNKILEFNNFINTLNTTKYYSVSIAFNKYEEIFKKENFTAKDSAFIIFDKFYNKVNIELNEGHQEVSSDYDVLFNNYQDAIKYEIPQVIINYKKDLNDNGFDILTSEGTTYISTDRNYISKNFYKYISTKMKEYCSFINTNEKEGTYDDGQLTISVIELAKRLLWLENFIHNNENFILINECKNEYKTFLTILFNGSGNSPILNEELTISQNYFDGYNYLILENNDTETTNLLIPYYKLLQGKDSLSIENYIRKLVDKGLIFQ